MQEFPETTLATTSEDTTREAELDDGIDGQFIYDFGEVILCLGIINQVSEVDGAILILYFWCAVQLYAQFERETHTTVRYRTSETQTKVGTELLHLDATTHATIAFYWNGIVTDNNTSC